MTQGGAHEGLQEQIDELSRRLDVGDAERRSLSDRADATESRSDGIAAQADLDREMIVDLQAAGVVTAQHARDLETALRSSRLIGAAIGILMESRGLDEDQAFGVLRQASQDQNRKVRDLASDIVAQKNAQKDQPPSQG